MKPRMNTKGHESRGSSSVSRTLARITAACQRCGCTHDNPCISSLGHPCWWVIKPGRTSPGLCNQCLTRKERKPLDAIQDLEMAEALVDGVIRMLARHGKRRRP